MANESLSKQFDFKLVETFGGYNSTQDPTNLAPNFLVRGSQNVYKKINGNIAVRPGLQRRGSADASQSPISSEFIWNTSWGETYPLIVSDGYLQVEVDGSFHNLKAFTETRFVFDKWYDAQEAKDIALFVNGTDDLFHWSGGVAYLSSAGTSSLVKTDPSVSWFQSGFTKRSGEQSLIINGTTYTYTGGEDTSTLTGVSPTPIAEPANSIVLQSVITDTNTPATDFDSGFLKVVNNQVYVGSYTSRLCYISSDATYDFFTVPTPRTPGSPELLTLDSTLNGIGVRNGNAFISYGTSEWAEVKFENITVGSTLTQQTIVDIKPAAKNAAAYAHEFIGMSGNNIIYLSQDQQVRILGDFNQLFTTGFPSLSLDINAELAEETFTGGGLKCIGEFTYVTAPVSGKTYLYQVRQRVDERGVIVDERLWHSPFVWNATRIDDIGGDIYAFSNANPQIYKVWDTNQFYDDSPSDEPLPYTAIAAFAYQQGGKRALLKEFDKVYTEGYLTSGTPLNLRLNYEYQGGRSQIIAVINSISQPVSLFASGVGALGDEPLGDTPLGMEIIEQGSSDLQKFRCINSLSTQNVFEFQPIYYSDQANAQWEIETYGTNMELANQEQPIYIINKIRN